MVPMVSASLKIKEILSTLPDEPGIYLYYNILGELIYVGKATSLKNRVRSYFSGQKTPRPIEEMIHEVVDISYETTDSVLEAIILEANTIKERQPKYNVLGKDDKSWNYIVISNNDYPEVYTLRQHDLKQMTEPEKKKEFRDLFGPYPGLNMKVTLKLLRRLFLFSDCEPGSDRPCLYRQMGECLGKCTGEISAPEYRERVIRPLTLFLQGRKKLLIEDWEKRMNRAAKTQNFEEAARLRDQLSSLQRIQDIALLNRSFVENEAEKDPSLKNLRIEGYDISNLGTSDKVGSMVVFNENGPVKSQYRKFTIKTVEGQSDIDCMKEVIDRRLNHSEWPWPSAFLIDGGRIQVSAVLSILEKRRIKIPVVGIAKGPERKRNDFILGTKTPEFIQFVSKNQRLLIAVRDEAHRFAITFNRSKRKIVRSKKRL